MHRRRRSRRARAIERETGRGVGDPAGALTNASDAVCASSSCSTRRAALPDRRADAGSSCGHRRNASATTMPSTSAGPSRTVTTIRWCPPLVVLQFTSCLPLRSIGKTVTMVIPGGGEGAARSAVVTTAFVALVGYIVLAAAALGFGFLLTRELLHGVIGDWDVDGDRVAGRTADADSQRPVASWARTSPTPLWCSGCS